MNLSVVIIVHNEEKYIAQCIISVLDQHLPADEIIVIVHNSTDKTLEIAKQFPVKTVPLQGPTGSAYARIRGLQEVQGTTILCIDGDCIAESNWTEIMLQQLKSQHCILIGSWIKFQGNIYNTISNIYNKYFCAVSKPTYWLWGGSFGFSAKNKEAVIRSLQQGILLSEQLGLSRNPDDYWLATDMNKLGTIHITNKTFVTHYPKEQTIQQAWHRHKENMKNGKIMRFYIRSIK